MQYGTIFAYPKPHGTLRDERVFKKGDAFTEVQIHDVFQDTLKATCKMMKLKEPIIFEVTWRTSSHWSRAISSMTYHKR